MSTTRSNSAQARKLAEEAVARDDTRLTEALLADAIGHLVAEVESLSERIVELECRADFR